MNPIVMLDICNLNKFIPSFIKLVNDQLQDEGHQFWLAGAQKLNQHPISFCSDITGQKSDTLWAI